MLLLFLRAYSLGGGTYTGIEAVSNGLQIMREPRVATGKRTMALHGASRSRSTASGILVALPAAADASPCGGKTMNAVLAEQVFGRWELGGLPVGYWLVLTTLISEGALLFVAAQAGFIDGPRVMANMAVDSCFPHRFAALSERLTMQNGVLLMGVAALACSSTRAATSTSLVVHVLDQRLPDVLALAARHAPLLVGRPRGHQYRWRRIALFGSGALLCVTILAVTVAEKFGEGGWITLALTVALLAGCALVRRHYQASSRRSSSWTSTWRPRRSSPRSSPSRSRSRRGVRRRSSSSAASPGSASTRS